MKEWVFHVRHNAKPTTVKEVLLILDGRDDISIDDILEVGKEYGYTIGTTAKSAQSVRENPVQTARDLGLVESGRYALTDLGQQLVRLLQVKPKTVNEFLHFLHYSIWTPEDPGGRCFSWSYLTACNMLWEFGNVSIDRNQLASQLADVAREKFGISNVSLSKDSVQGILNWLDELDPPVLRKGKLDKKGTTSLTRRSFCPPETFVLAVDYFYQRQQVNYQTNLLLDSDKRDAICKVCLLEPSNFDATLDWACGQFDFLNQGTSGGWGRHVTLARAPALVDFMG
jgi:hypothetical protein